MIGAGDDFLATVVALLVALAIYDVCRTVLVRLWALEVRRRRVRHHLVAMRAHIERNAGVQCGACGQALGTHTAVASPAWMPPGAFAQCPRDAPSSPASGGPAPIFVERPAQGRN